MTDEYYETLGMIYEYYNNGYITESEKETLVSKLKSAKNNIKKNLKKYKKTIIKITASLALITAAIGLGLKLNDDEKKKVDEIKKAKKELGEKIVATNNLYRSMAYQTYTTGRGYNNPHAEAAVESIHLALDKVYDEAESISKCSVFVKLLNKAKRIKDKDRTDVTSLHKHLRNELYTHHDDDVHTGIDYINNDDRADMEKWYDKHPEVREYYKKSKIEGTAGTYKYK